MSMHMISKASAPPEPAAKPESEDSKPKEGSKQATDESTAAHYMNPFKSEGARSKPIELTGKPVEDLKSLVGKLATYASGPILTANRETRPHAELRSNLLTRPEVEAGTLMRDDWTGNPYDIGSEAWVEYGRKTGVWVQLPTNKLDRMTKDYTLFGCTVETSASLANPNHPNYENALNSLRENLAFGLAAVVSGVHVLKIDKVKKSKLLPEHILASATSKSIKNTREFDEFVRKIAPLIAKALREPSNQNSEQLYEEFRRAATDVMGQLLGKPDEKKIIAIESYAQSGRSAHRRHEFREAYHDGWTRINQILGRASRTASPEQLAKLAKEALKVKRLNNQVKSKGGDNQGDANQASAEKVDEIHYNNATRDVAKDLFWAKLRVGSVDWAPGNVNKEIEEGDMKRLALTLTDHRSTTNLNAMFHELEKSVEGMAKDLGLELYKNDSETAAKVGKAISQFQKDYYTQLIQLAQTHPDIFDELSEIMKGFIRESAADLRHFASVLEKHEEYKKAWEEEKKRLETKWSDEQAQAGVKRHAAARVRV